MVRPARFGFNPQTAASNTFQQRDADLPGDDATQRLVLLEFDGVAKALGLAKSDAA